MDQVVKKLEKIDTHIETIQANLVTIEKTLIRNTESLELHMFRTALAEKAIEKMHDDLAPIKKHVTKVETGLQLFGLFSVAITALVGIVKLFTTFL